MIAPILWIEGLIASGKTTFAKEVAKRLGFKILEEPVDTNPYLDEFYKDPARYAFGLQIFMLHHRYTMKQIASYEAARGVEKGIVLDRCLPGDRVFAKMHWRAGNISDLDFRCYEYCYQIMARSFLPPTILIYLNCQPETAYRRLKERNRGCETGVTLEYLQQLKAGYEELLMEVERGLVPWSHSVKVHSIIHDKDTLSDTEWEYTIRTVADLCKRV